MCVYNTVVYGTGLKLVVVALCTPERAFEEFYACLYSIVFAAMVELHYNCDGGTHICSKYKK